MSCVFCENQKIALENELAFARWNDFPVSKGHMLFITKRHVENFLDITEEERIALFALVDEFKKRLDADYAPDGYNLAINCGVAAGQTVMHVHVHLIPRYFGDVEKDEKSGIEEAIAHNKKNYGLGDSK